MNKLDRSKIQVPSMSRPHVVVLGAGASFASFPNGDKNGRILPLMRNIVDAVGLRSILDDAGIHEYHNDFEKLFSILATSGKHDELVAKIEQSIFSYFAGMELPDGPTLYDHLVLSLRDKDVIATFNWDPFLAQAMIRNEHIKSLPKTLFLHGNVAIGHCMNHSNLGLGSRGHNCHICGKPFSESRLLYPVTKKNYSNDPFIKKSWELLQSALKVAYIVTFFGYSVPVTDVEAIDLLRQGWGDKHDRNLEEIEIIDIKDEDSLYETWKPFIHSHHYRTPESLYESTIGYSPRRSCEAMWDTLMDRQFIGTNPVPTEVSWNELYAWLGVMIEDEKQWRREQNGWRT